MKKILVLLSLIITVIACKNEASNFTKIEAEYIYVADAAVLKGKDFIYGVVLDDKANELTEKVKPMKKDQYDMVPVIIEGIIKPNPSKEGWEKVVEIKKIVKILPVSTKSTDEKVKVNIVQ